MYILGLVQLTNKQGFPLIIQIINLLTFIYLSFWHPTVSGKNSYIYSSCSAV